MQVNSRICSVLGSVSNLGFPEPETRVFLYYQTRVF